jgi:hypothetical protein
MAPAAPVDLRQAILQALEHLEQATAVLRAALGSEPAGRQKAASDNVPG